MTSNYNTNTIERTVQTTLERLGLTSGLISYSQAFKTYGRWFADLVKMGDIRPIMRGAGRNATKHFLVSDILEKIDNAKRQAYSDLVINQ